MQVGYIIYVSWSLSGQDLQSVVDSVSGLMSIVAKSIGKRGKTKPVTIVISWVFSPVLTSPVVDFSSLEQQKEMKE